VVDLFKKELEELINRHSIENVSNTPDFILAQYIKASLGAFNTAVQQRETWYDRDSRPAEIKSKLIPKMSKKLTNKDISDFYRDHRFVLLPGDFTGAFQYWVTSQGRSIEDKDLLLKAGLSFNTHIVKPMFDNLDVPERFSYDDLEKIINEQHFKGITDIMAVNQTEKDFIDLGALARNVRFMIMREQITQPL